MDVELEKYKEKISNYCIEELEEILISLNKDKFPEKYDLVKNCLAEKIQNKLGPSVKTFEDIKNIENKKEPQKEIIQEIKQKITNEQLSYENSYNNSTNIVQVIFYVLIIFTSIIAAYVLLLTNYNLPGKKFIFDACKNVSLFNSSEVAKSEKIS